ncbi:C-4 sterol methyl oxidase [Penicillium rubens]|nr:C-4 sterol methyl oxidase [Penicillium rubens]
MTSFRYIGKLEDIESDLYYACLTGLHAVAIKLLEAGSNVNAQGGECRCPLNAALSTPIKAAKRYADTRCLFTEWIDNAPESERANAAFARLNFLPSHYQKAGKISNDDMLYPLAVLALDPKRWIEQYQWRKLNEMELCAFGRFWKSAGDAMGISYEYLPSYKPGFTDGLHWLDEIAIWVEAFEPHHMVPDTNCNLVADHTTDLLNYTLPKPLHNAGKKCITVLLDERLRKAMMNSTVLPPGTYWGQYQDITKSNTQLSVAERLWVAWYAWVQNDVLATGIMSFLIHELFYFGRSLPWIFIDSLDFFNRYKIQSSKVPSLREQWDCAKFVLLSHFTVELPQIWLFHPMAQFFGLSTSIPFPSPWTMTYQIAIFFVMEDTWHYFFHRALHWGPLYKAIHKVHHQYSAPFGLAAEYASPIEVMILGFGTVSSPILWCAFTGNLHILTMYIWIVLRLFQAVDAHSGYEFPWSLHHFLPFWAGADHHDLHHEKFIGNYSSSFRWWDYLLDTDYTPDALKRRREQKVKAKKTQ